MSSYNRGTVTTLLEKWGLALVIMLVLSTFTLSSQEDRRERRKRHAHVHTEVNDSLAVPALSDSARAVRDSIHRADSIHALDSMRMLSKSSLEAPAFTAAIAPSVSIC